MKNILSVIRIRDWWNAIIVPVLSFYFIGLFYAPVEINGFSLLKIFWLLVLSFFTAALGFYLNEFTDIEADKKAGKKNLVASFSSKKAIVLLYILIVFAVLSLIPFRENATICLLFAIQILLFALYSCPPIRLKRRPIAAVVLDSLYSGTLFFFIALIYAKAQLSNHLMVLTFCFGFFKGLRNILFHLEKDTEIDQKAGQNTLAHILRENTLSHSQILFFCIEILCLLLILFEASKFSAYVLLLGLFVLIIKINYYTFYIDKRHESEKKWLSEINTLYEVWLPIAVIFGIVHTWGWQAILWSSLGLVILFPSTYKIFNELYLTLLNIYYIGYKIYYFVSDLYFIHTKPHFDVGKWWRNLISKNEHN